MDPVGFANLFETLMLVAFGLAWPTNIVHSLRRKSTAGKNPVFLVIIIVGYLFGITANVVRARHSGHVDRLLFFFYLVNTSMVSFDLFLYCVYRRRERARARLRAGGGQDAGTGKPAA
jgi:hypothetical protein